VYVPLYGPSAGGCIFRVNVVHFSCGIVKLLVEGGFGLLTGARDVF